MQVECFLEQSAERFPDKTALVVGSARLTYRQVDALCNRLAHGLLSLGLRRGDRVAVYLENSVEAVVAVLATLKAGGVFMMINPTTKAEKLAYLLSDSGATVLIARAPRDEEVRLALDGVLSLESLIAVGEGRVARAPRTKRCIWWADLLARHMDRSDVPPKRSIDADIAALIYTSGSTGSPKGVVMTHANMVAAATSITTYLENTPDDIILNVLPLSFDYGLYQILMGFKIGGTVVLERSFVYPHAVLQKMREEQVTGFPIVPTISAILLEMDLARYPLPALRYITNTGAALPTRHIEGLRRAFPGARLYSMFGLTECKRVSYLPPAELDRRPGSVGKAMPNVEAYIVDEAGRTLRPGEVGELVVRGSNVMRGYWNRPHDTDRVLKPGPVPGERVLYTGDLFKMDEDGYLYWIGRRDDMIKSRGEKVSPKEVENVLYSLEGVGMAAVVGVPDPVLGQAVKAVITLKDGCVLTPQEVLRHCAHHLEDFMVPKLVEFREAMPKTPTGKIDRRQLAAES